MIERRGTQSSHLAHFLDFGEDGFRWAGGFPAPGALMDLPVAWVALLILSRTPGPKSSPDQGLKFSRRFENTQFGPSNCYL